MANGVGVVALCDMVGFAATKPQDRGGHRSSWGYCDTTRGVKRWACETWDEASHGGQVRKCAGFYCAGCGDSDVTWARCVWGLPPITPPPFPSLSRARAPAPIQRCPAPKYEAYHGFRNGVAPDTAAAFRAFDLEYIQVWC